MTSLSNMIFQNLRSSQEEEYNYAVLKVSLELSFAMSIPVLICPCPISSAEAGNKEKYPLFGKKPQCEEGKRQDSTTELQTYHSSRLHRIIIRMQIYIEQINNLSPTETGSR